MPKLTAATALAALLNKLAKQRAKHEAVIAKHQAQLDEINAVFTNAGLQAESKAAPARRGRKPGVKGRRRTRRSFAVSGEESVLGFVKKAGNPTTADVNKHWQEEGRGGKADNTLTKLVAGGQLKRIKDKEVRGSRYAIA